MKKTIKSIILLSTIIFAFNQSINCQFFNQSGTIKPDIDYKTEYNLGSIVFKFDLIQDYHITDLRNGFFTIKLKKNEYVSVKGVSFPNGVIIDDENVFKGSFDVKVYLKNLKDIPPEGTGLSFSISYQICQEKPVEVCYPPETEDITVHIKKNFNENTGALIKDSSVANLDKKEENDFSSWLEKTIKNELEKKSLLLFLLVFLGGFLTSFTPCVYPVIPIVMGYIGTRSGESRFKGFFLSIFFVLGLALVYSILGVVAALTGSMMGLTFQNPIVVIVIAAIFIIMGLSLAGFFEIPVPSSISSRVKPGNKSEILGAIIVGGVAGIIAAPCVGPVLIALLSYISQTGNIFLGFWLTFIFSLGLGVIFLIAGTFSGAISSMPKGGKWMDYVKYFFALLLIGGGLYFLGMIISHAYSLILWGVFLIAVSVFSGLFKHLEENKISAKIFKLIIVLLLIIGSLIFVKGFEMIFFPGSSSTLNPKSVIKAVGPEWIKDIEKGKKIAMEEKKYMMADSYADWCIACKELDEKTFSDPEVVKLLSDFITVKLDFTEGNEENGNIRKELKIIGMPTVIFFNSSGIELDRFSGFYNKEKFMKFVKNRILGR